MKFIIYINIFDNKSEIVINDEYIILRYIDELDKREIIINYYDIEYLHMSKYGDIYHISIEDENTVVEFNIKINDVYNLEKCRELCNKVSMVMKNYYSKEELDFKYKENYKKELIKFHIERKYTSDYRTTKIVTLIALILFAITGLNILKVV